MARLPTFGSSINPTEIHDILRNDRRRRAIEYLQPKLNPVPLRELSERIAEIESGESPPPRKLRESVYNSLHQTHLPKLDERGIVEYDDDRKKVELRDKANDVTIYMEVITKHGISWATLYRTVSVFSLISIVAAEVDLPIFSSVPTLIWASTFLVILAVATSYQLWSRRWIYLRPLLS